MLSLDSASPTITQAEIYVLSKRFVVKQESESGLKSFSKLFSLSTSTTLEVLSDHLVVTMIEFGIFEGSLIAWQTVALGRVMSYRSRTHVSLVPGLNVVMKYQNQKNLVYVLKYLPLFQPIKETLR